MPIRYISLKADHTSLGGHLLMTLRSLALSISFQPELELKLSLQGNLQIKLKFWINRGIE